jgi:hypothetical protein
VLAQALAAASASSAPHLRAEALFTLAPHLPAAEQPAAFDQALEAASALNRTTALKIFPVLFTSSAGRPVRGPVASFLAHVQRWWP